MKTARIIFLFPLAFLRLVLILLISGYVVVVGWFWLQLKGFSMPLQNWAMRTWGKSILFVCGIKVDKNELPDNSHFILMPNHRSYIDIFIVAAFTPAAFVAKAELKNWPFLKTGAKITNTIFVSRAELQSLVATMNKIKKSVNNHIPVALFPEGTTSKGPLTKSFKNGSFKIAADTKIPVIPMAIHFEDENDAWIDDDTFVGHFFRQMSKPVTKATVRYGKPLSNSDYKVLQKETRNQIDSMLNAILSGTG
ncbi:1-acyl-sn-glycerol-3-phosphate acyltransferase [Tangfeifania diversioriginum]|uniref:1-acyl-sn-glycerol-3-phosphate acyltransferase n=1 Tax=Tangfeifania diversioriginum TaxID=1168035 RepID=A0A1M6JT25_9BACT|nr:lysophospholipid acyltransferase family protein [Tangfeifania diversioriginum]SHJ49858.1 1-acyl-sn-glycerol-3-phosphate acyltransferase [Tangfeifania diversioriginum]